MAKAKKRVAKRKKISKRGKDVARNISVSFKGDKRFEVNGANFLP